MAAQSIVGEKSLAFAKRIAVTSPGGMYSGQKVQDLAIEEISSERRNPILADVMAHLDLMEKRGSGLKRIMNETKELEGYKDELKPVFKSTTSQFMTIIYSVDYKDTGKDTDTGKEKSKEKSKEKTLDKVYQLILKNHKITTAELAELCGVSENSIYKTVRKLRESDRIIRRGGDNGGEWEIIG